MLLLDVHTFHWFGSVNSTTAEVLDKLEFPWLFHRYLPTLGVLACTVALAASIRLPLRVAGLLLAIVWATIYLWSDPWFTPDIGPALRAELTSEQSGRWIRTIFVQALLPLAMTAPVFSWRTLQSAFRRQSPR